MSGAGNGMRRHAVVRAWRRRIAVTLSVLMAACGTPSLAPEIDPEQWQYQGEQRLPELVQLAGTLTVSRGDATRFEGTLDLQRTDASGRVQRVAGLVRGRRTPASIDFDVTFEGGVMRHVGRSDDGRHAGTWVDAGGPGGSLVSGAFTLVRRP
jgi:hypothetical protein